MTANLDVCSAQYAHLEFCEVLDCNGKRLGLLEQLYLDADDLHPVWGQVIGGFRHMRRMLVPLTQEAVDGVTKNTHNTSPHNRTQLQVAVTTAAAQQAPLLDATDGLSAAEEAALRKHYGLQPRQ